MPKVRQQLSMFVPHPAAAEIEAVRRIVDPLQFQLVPAHVTLCREDELSGFPALKERLVQLSLPPLALYFAQAQRFHGHGLLLPCTHGAGEFRRLRETVLGTSDIRDQTAHITLAHPRNPQATCNIVGMILPFAAGIGVRFESVNLIEQVDDGPWRVLAQWPLKERETAGTNATEEKSGDAN